MGMRGDIFEWLYCRIYYKYLGIISFSDTCKRKIKPAKLQIFLSVTDPVGSRIGRMCLITGCHAGSRYHQIPDYTIGLTLPVYLYILYVPDQQSVLGRYILHSRTCFQIHSDHIPCRMAAHRCRWDADGLCSTKLGYDPVSSDPYGIDIHSALFLIQSLQALTNRKNNLRSVVSLMHRDWKSYRCRSGKYPYRKPGNLCRSSVCHLFPDLDLICLPDNIPVPSRHRTWEKYPVVQTTAPIRNGA